MRKDEEVDKNSADIKRQTVEFLFAANSQKIPTLPGNALDKFMNVTTLNLINVSLSNITYRHFKDMVQLKYLDLSCNKLRKLPRKLFKECENLTDISFTNNQVRIYHESYKLNDLMIITYSSVYLCYSFPNHFINGLAQWRS